MPGWMATDIRVSTITELVICLGDGDRMFFRPDAEVTADRLALRVFYSEQSRGSVRVVVDAQDPDRPFRYLELRPFRRVGVTCLLASACR